MKTHDEIREMVALAAAGVLEAEEQVAVDRHVAGCEDCQRELEIFGMYAAGLAEMPQPVMPAGLMEKTLARVERAREGRGSDVLLGLLALFSAVCGVGTWMVVRAVTGGGLSALSLSTLLVWATAGAAVVMLAKRDELARRM